jgi:hypothetical protein
LVMAFDLSQLPTYAQGQTGAAYDAIKNPYGFREIGSFKDFYTPTSTRLGASGGAYRGEGRDEVEYERNRQLQEAMATSQLDPSGTYARQSFDLGKNGAIHAAYQLRDGQWVPVEAYNVDDGYKKSVIRAALGTAALFGGGALLANAGVLGGGTAVGGTGLSAGAPGAAANGLYGLGTAGAEVGSGIGATAGTTLGTAGSGLIASPSVVGAYTAAASGGYAGAGATALDYLKQGYDIYNKGKKVYNAVNTVRGLLNPPSQPQQQPQQGMGAGVQMGGGLSGGLSNNWRRQSAADAYTQQYLQQSYGPIAQARQRRLQAEEGD